MGSQNVFFIADGFGLLIQAECGWDFAGRILRRKPASRIPPTRVSWS